MTLDEAIRDIEEAIKRKEAEARKFAECNRSAKTLGFCDLSYILAENDCVTKIKKNKQLVEWLKDYKRLKEQEPILDKVKAEIEQTEINGHIRDVECFRTGINVALNVIDKYKSESES